MLQAGLVSITFRQLSPGEIVALTVRAGLAGIEWGGDVHAPPGDLASAAEIRRMTLDAGLQVAAYGSYYRAGHEEPQKFSAVLKTALALGAPVIRVWSGKIGSAGADAAYRRQVIDDLCLISRQAAAEKIRIACEFHGNTLTDTAAATRELIQAVADDNFGTYWQPPVGLDPAEAARGLESLLPWLMHVHAFSWQGTTRLPLSAGAAAWEAYLRIIAGSGRDHAVMLEFVRDDAPAAFLEDAAVLRHWLAAAAER